MFNIPKPVSNVTTPNEGGKGNLKKDESKGQSQVVFQLILNTYGKKGEYSITVIDSKN